MKRNKWIISQREFQQSILQAIRVFPAVSTGEREEESVRMNAREKKRERERARGRERCARSLCALCLRGLRFLAVFAKASTTALYI